MLPIQSQFSLLCHLKKIKAGIRWTRFAHLYTIKSVRKMNKEKGAWLSFVTVIENFLGNKKANNYETLVTNLLSAFYDLGCNMRVKLHFLYSHFDRFPENLRTVSDKKGKQFHHDLKSMEEHIQGRWDKHMMTNYCWNIKWDCPETVHKQKSFKH